MHHRQFMIFYACVLDRIVKDWLKPGITVMMFFVSIFTIMPASSCAEECKFYRFKRIFYPTYNLIYQNDVIDGNIATDVHGDHISVASGYIEYWKELLFNYIVFNDTAKRWELPANTYKKFNIRCSEKYCSKLPELDYLLAAMGNRSWVTPEYLNAHYPEGCPLNIPPGAHCNDSIKKQLSGFGINKTPESMVSHSL